MNKLFTRGWIEFLAVFLGLGLSFNIEEWREERQIKDKLFGDYHSIKLDLENDIPYLSELFQNMKKLQKTLSNQLKYLMEISLLIIKNL